MGSMEKIGRVLNARHKGSNIQKYSLLLASETIQENTIALRNKLAMNMEMALSGINIRPTGAIEPVAVSSDPLFPRPFQFLLLGGLAGLLASAILLLRRPVLCEPRTPL